jgi:DNA mismatch repair protein MutL
MTPSINLNTSGSPGMPQFTLANTGNKNPALINRETGEIIESKSKDDSFDNKNINRTPVADFNPIPKPAEVNSVLTAFDAVFGKTKEIRFESEQTTAFENRPVIESEKFFWQLHAKYIFAQTEDGCIVIDQHAAHERIIYEKALKIMNNHFARTQEVLFPIDVSLTPSEMSFAKELKTELTELGYDFELIEPNKAIIQGVPIDVAGKDETKSFKEIIELFEEYQKIRSTNKRDNIAASFACKAAIKTGNLLSQEEMLNLFNDLMKCNVPYACPHGRPVILSFKLTDFDKKFGRLL